MFVDAWDMLFLGTANEMYAYADKYRGFVTHHSEKICWPKDRVYPEPQTPWSFVNGSGPAGRGSLIVEAIDYGLKHFPIVDDGSPVTIDTEQDNDQRFWTDVYLAGFGRVDQQCELSQSLTMSSNGDFSVKDSRLINKVTGSKPLFVHANGVQSMIGFGRMMDMLASKPFVGNRPDEVQCTDLCYIVN